MIARWNRPSAYLVLAALVVLLIGAGALAPGDGQFEGSSAPAAATAPTAVLPPARVPSLSPPGPPVTDTAHMRTTDIDDHTLDYCANGSVDHLPTEIKRVIFVIHGNDRQPCAVAASVLGSGTPEQRLSTLVVAPHFATTDDPIDRSRDLYWTSRSWSRGDQSANQDVSISSFSVLDELLVRVHHPQVIVAGFSGGGQFVSRYAATTAMHPTRFLVVNPSSYLYFTPDRPGAPQSQLDRCPTYNDYRYGVDNLNDYAGRVGGDGMLKRFRSQTVTFLLGEADSDQRSPSMDKSCAAMAQGSQRFERGKRYHAYLTELVGPEVAGRFDLYQVKGVSHDVSGMFSSAAGRRALFG